MQCVKPRPCLDFFFFFHYSSLLTQFLSLITHHLKYPNSLHEVCLAPSLKYFYYFVGPILTHSQALIILSLSLSLFLVFSTLGCMETSLHPFRPTKTSPVTPPSGLAAPRWLCQLFAGPLGSLLHRRPFSNLKRRPKPPIRHWWRSRRA